MAWASSHPLFYTCLLGGIVLILQGLPVVIVLSSLLQVGCCAELLRFGVGVISRIDSHIS